MRALRLLLFSLLILMPLLQGCKSTTVVVQPGFAPTPIPSPSGSPQQDSTPLPGNEGGNGGNTITKLTGSAWFIGERFQKTIKVCVVAGENFGFPLEKAKIEIAKAYQIWGNYISNRQIQFTLDEKEYIPTTRIQFVDCQKSYDLKFYLGARDEAVEAAKKYYSEPVGFAHRESYDSEQGWGRGFIWIAGQGEVDSELNFPAWKRASLRAVLLHEIGHTLGCEHVAGTIMRENIAGYLKNSLIWYDKKNIAAIFSSMYSRIDQERYLVIPQEISSNPINWSNEFRLMFPKRNADSTGALDLIFGEKVDENVIAYAIHYPGDGDMTNLRIVYWRQNAQSNYYSYFEKQRRSHRMTAEEFHALPPLPGMVQLDIPVRPIAGAGDWDQSVFKMFKKGLKHAARYDGGASQYFTGEVEIRGVKYNVDYQLNGSEPNGRILVVVKINTRESIRIK